MSDTFRTHDGRTLQQAASDLVHREVLCCMSSMVSTLAQGLLNVEIQTGALSNLSDQAFELCAPVLDYEGAAEEAGWSITGGGIIYQGLYNASKNGAASDEDVTDWCQSREEAAQAACEIDDIEPHELEVYEHWAVSTWLAEKLQAAGERVDTDFAGLNIWARTTTGQAISIDAVIERITREMHSVV